MIKTGTTNDNPLTWCVNLDPPPMYSETGYAGRGGVGMRSRRHSGLSPIVLGDLQQNSSKRSLLTTNEGLSLILRERQTRAERSTLDGTG